MKVTAFPTPSYATVVLNPRALLKRKKLSGDFELSSEHSDYGRRRPQIANRAVETIQ
jgi:hypothetical protein